MPDVIEPEDAWWEGVFNETAGQGEVYLKSLVRAVLQHNVELQEQLEEMADRSGDAVSLTAHIDEISQRCRELSLELEAAKQKLDAATAMSIRWRDAAEAAERQRNALREQAGRATDALAGAQRDAERWKRAADFLQLHLSALRLGPTGPSAKPEERYRRIKAVLSKGLHPDNLRGLSGIELDIRQKIFKELWPQIERIDRDR